MAHRVRNDLAKYRLCRRGIARATAWETNMSLLSLIVTLVVVGVLLWLVNNYIPMDSKIKSILNVVVVILVVLWLLQAFGLLGSLGGVRVG
jgi:ABC-type siderophore export system fused ATPase/permease subunit